MNVKLLVVQGRPQGKSLVFPPGEYVFGRGAECHIRPNSEWVSRQHCILRVTPRAVFIRDLGSRNGTLVNGVRVVDEVGLGHGDQVQVGPLVFEVRLDRVAEARPASTGALKGSSDEFAIPDVVETAELPPLDNGRATEEYDVQDLGGNEVYSVLPPRG
jgi:pSer/pThr/pTyr-binding forkhead associated (FHA) protein